LRVRASAVAYLLLLLLLLCVLVCLLIHLLQLVLTREVEGHLEGEAQQATPALLCCRCCWHGGHNASTVGLQQGQR
jgi:hypothetical protein